MPWKGSGTELTMSRNEQGSQCFEQGFNCTQVVLSTFCDDYGLSKDVGLKIAGGMGSGVRSANICGAVTGAILVIGLKYGHDKAEDHNAKNMCNQKTEEFLRRFEEIHGTVICRELLECDIFTEEGRERAMNLNLFTTVCADYVSDAIDILEGMGL